MSKRRIINPVYIVLAAAIVALLTAAVLIWAAVIAQAATISTGVGASTEPVCSSTELHPGHSYQLWTGGSSGSTGMYVDNTGTSSESVSIAVVPVLRGQDLYGAGRHVPAWWVSFSYPKMLWLFGTHSVSLGAGASTSIPVSVSIPGNAKAGTYVADLEASTGSSSGHVSLGAGATTYLLFTVDSKPIAKVLDHSGTCWAAPGHYESWAAWSGTGKPTPPPGWWWEKGQVNAWAYTPPGGWEFDWNTVQHPHQVYTGARPTHPCANPADYPQPGGGDFIGGQYPDTSTSAGCAAWLAASADHKLTEEPDVPSKDPAHPLPVRVHLAHAASTTSKYGTSTSPVIGILLLAAAVTVILRYVPRAVRRVSR
jgi:hypothetical protein